MNLTQVELLKRILLKEPNQTILEENSVETEMLYSSQNDSAGGKASENSGKQDIDAPQASDDKRAKDNSGRAQSEDITNKAKDQKDGASITEPDTNLTGDTGNLDIGQTDLGASGTGSEDL